LVEPAKYHGRRVFAPFTRQNLLKRDSMAQEIRELLRNSDQGVIGRREFTRRAPVFSGSLAAALTLVGSNRSPAQAQVDADDDTILWQNVEFAGATGAVAGYFARRSACPDRPAPGGAPPLPETGAGLSAEVSYPV
jgi:hypothetical protein